MKIKNNLLLIKKTKRLRIKLPPNGQQIYSMNYVASNRRMRSISISGVTLSWEGISVYSKRKNNCCKKKSNSDSDSKMEIFQTDFEMQSVSSNGSSKKSSTSRHQILNNGKFKSVIKIKKKLNFKIIK